MTKTLTFACLHVSVAFTVVYLMTGNMMVGGAVALLEPACNTVAYFFHEQFWERRRARQRSADSPARAATSGTPATYAF
ncbi:MAG: DUF2061 domain-containing protein [Spongiibacteraceae bacterium]|jgi:uncharacterized membrane protein|nr:DUF2061 domain-containing protein [Spongiibacteraceae bacterium]